MPQNGGFPQHLADGAYFVLILPVAVEAFREDLKRCCPRECGLKNNGNKRGQCVLGGPQISAPHSNGQPQFCCQ